jgi:hypothetical protein
MRTLWKLGLNTEKIKNLGNSELKESRFHIFKENDLLPKNQEQSQTKMSERNYDVLKKDKISANTKILNRYH